MQEFLRTVGIPGLWFALLLASAGFTVSVIDVPAPDGALLAPGCGGAALVLFLLGLLPFLSAGLGKEGR